MVRKYLISISFLLLMSFVLWGCPKKVEIIPPEKLPPKDPIAKLLEKFSSAESLTARTSIRIVIVKDGEETHFPTINGFLLYQKPDKLRVVGFSPLPFATGLFDALYRNGEFFLLVVPQKRAYTGEVSQFEDLIERAGPIEVSSEKPEGNEIPNRIRIHVVDKETRIDLRLKEISINSSLPADTFQWTVPEGVDVQPLAQLLKKKRLR
jgi:outer membrane lipoprotein-sorting protein